MYLWEGDALSQRRAMHFFFRGLIERMSWHKIFSTTKPHQPSTYLHSNPSSAILIAFFDKALPTTLAGLKAV